MKTSELADCFLAIGKVKRAHVTNAHDSVALDNTPKGIKTSRELALPTVR